ncbi:Ig-like domain-containing protein [Microbacterium sp. KUDC0406]|uniref:Ig-like domain-containing protein n=1 Tax=Microbacterium sp. KUDC0406 TaxID=2909588 RepID=UPI001F4669A0|nr:Ig-like domain-containing protein [Microbacterium sp. KUDC0406]UJP09190.1 Ig-like domain-containing protein [Microbacterium sp. KUDC0406]
MGGRAWGRRIGAWGARTPTSIAGEPVMKALSWVRTRPKTLASAAAVTVGVVTITTLAMAYDGNPTTEVDLNDGGVWITKASDLLVGHFNNESTLLDGGLRTTGQDFDILQDESTIMVVNQDDSTLTPVDPATVSLGDATSIPAGAKVALREQTTAILDPASGDLWVVPPQNLGGFEFAGADPVAELGKNADVAVGDDGTVYAVSPSKSAIYTIPVTPQGDPEEPTSAAVEGLKTGSKASITTVGETPVVLDPAQGVVMTPDGLRTEIGDADSAVLQQVSGETDAVVVATASELVRVPLDGGEADVTSTRSHGVPAAPVQVLGCTYGAWGGSGAFVRDCAGDGADLAERIPGLKPSGTLEFRVNRDVVVLNDVVGGMAWIATESLQQVDNWNDITPPEGETEDEEDTTEETVETSLPERSEQNTKPVAEDDEFGVRPGGTTFLPVLDNDTDADGDVLVASLSSKQPSIGEVQPINNGSALQIAVPEDASGSASFEYEIDDGRKGTDTAKVSVSVHDWSVNGAPKPKRKSSLAVEAGGTVSYNVLPDWIDPDGDDLYLKDVVAANGDEVDFTTDGQITYRAVSSPPGRHEVQVVVADGSGELATGAIQLDVRPVGSTLPKTNADHVVTTVGQQVTVSPLANDTSSSKEPLRFASVDDVEGATVTPDYPNKTFTFKTDKPGTYYVQYLVTAGVPSAAGLVRIDVQEGKDEDLAPIAVRDVALLPTGGEVLVGVLNNDTDPAGGLLVVQSVSVEPGSGVSVSVLNHETLRIGDQGGLEDQVRITYRISNGKKTAEGDVIVIPIPAPDKLLPPVANDDTAVVRAGDVVTIPVLDNDTHPNDLSMHVQPELVEPFIDPEDGEAFVSQDKVRFRAGPEAKTVYATYNVVDENGQVDAGYITIQILAVDAEKNAAPRPRDVTARTLSGTTTNIAIPLDGIDQDGDSVELLGLDSNPKKGLVTVEQDYLVYEAFEDSTGTDTFTYKVRDNLGKEGIATVHVGIAPGEEVNQAPYAVKDAVVVRPGREVAVPVLANDSDPEGDQISLVKKGIKLPGDVPGLDGRVSGDRVLVQAPDSEIETSLRYTIVDERGAEASAVLQITVDKDVPLLFPIARDDRVKSEDVKDGTTVDIDVLANDEDPDGTTDALKLVVENGGTVLPDRKVRVKVGDERQLLRYTITDQDDQESSAFIYVPALDDLRPVVKPGKAIEVVSGETVEVPLADYVTVAGGGSVVITEAEKVSAAHANGDSLVKDERTLVYTSAQGYFGADALSFEVTDGTGPDDPKGRKATLSIPITVLPPANQQPSFTRGQVNVAPGEKAVSLNLAELTDDPDPEDKGKHTFTYVNGATDGISARVDGDQLFVEASSNTKKGTAATLRLRISDGETEPVEGTVDVTVTASTRELPTANTDTFPESNQGETITVSPLDNDVNPFQGEGDLRLISAERQSGDGEVTVAGDQVKITPGAKFVGTLTVRYRIGDVTEDPDREVDGLIVLTVQGKPDAPGKPTVSSVQDRTVVLSWSPPANNGAEITGYTVRSVQGASYEKQCSSTTCTLDGLTNNVKYLFQVTATNRVGESDPSPSSAEARPDARPDTPAAPTLTYGDKQLEISWKTPSTPGSPVEYYTLELSGGIGAGTKTNITGNSYTWTGLENGSSYTARVQAHNLAPDPSSWSGASLPEIPSGPPLAPAAPTTSELAAVGDRAQMEVTWKAPDDNGDSIDGYQVQVIRGSSVVQTIAVAAGKTSQAVVVDTSTTAYTYKVRAQNRSDWGDWSPASAARRAAIKPGTPGTPSVTAGDQKLTVTASSYTLAESDMNGASKSEMTYQYSLNGGGWKSDWNGTTISGVKNNTEYKVRIRAVASVSGKDYISDASGSSAGRTPFGKPPAPTVSAKNNGQSITFSWHDNGTNGAAITTQINVDGNGWKNASNNGSTTVGNGYSQNHKISVRTHNKAGYSDPASKSASTSAPPSPRVWVTEGPLDPQACVNGCADFKVNWENLNIGSKKVKCYSSAYPGGVSSYTYDVNFNGSGSKVISCHQGRDGVDVWVDIIGWGDSVDTEKHFWPRP